MSLVEHLEKLRHLVQVAKHPSIKSAAQSMGISQAGLSKSLSNLENVLDVQLFNRTHEGLTLTKEGRELLGFSQSIIQQANSIENKLKALKTSQVPAKFSIGMYDSIAVYLFSELNTYLREIYPNVEVQLIVKKSGELKDLVANGKLDLAIGVNLSNPLISNAESFLLYEDHYAFYIANNIKSKAPQLPIIYHPEAADSKGTKHQESLKKLIMKRGFHLVYNIESIKLLTTQGMGVGVLPVHVAESLVKKNALKQVRMVGMPLQFGLHSIDLLATKKMTKNNYEFVKDLCRLVQMWSFRS